MNRNELATKRHAEGLIGRTIVSVDTSPQNGEPEIMAVFTLDDGSTVKATWVFRRSTPRTFNFSVGTRVRLGLPHNGSGPDGWTGFEGIVTEGGFGSYNIFVTSDHGSGVRVYAEDRAVEYLPPLRRR